MNEKQKASPVEPRKVYRSPTNLMGVDADAPMEVNENGGKSSVAAGAFHLLPPLALQAVAFNLQHGAKKYGDWNWLLRDKLEHVNHSIIHCFAYLSGDTSDPSLPQYSPKVKHLIGAATRLLMAIEMELIEEAAMHKTEESRVEDNPGV